MICWKGWHTGKESKWQAEKRPFPKGTPFRTHIFLPTCSWWMIFWNSCNSFYLLFPTLWVRITDSFLPYWVFSYMYLFTVDTCLSGKGWTPGRHNRGWGKKSIPKGSCSLLKSISHHLNTTSHCDDIDSLQDMYLQCLAVSDFLVILKRKKKKKNKRGKKEYPHPHKHFF